ncbi:Glucose-6-phosphate 1-dehydrogenase [Hibiscus syriacus]|uniref:glucose-6-phosphate dehydrogenase (NADP(+)) n=1 Tax=Hibiscus syriacus TaxID=106335 RepID=A0A6A2WGE6_HIBSY|nr:Glucose-6-phosphate 1-dehydrogenase [Hibiscus syriacus]
MALRQTNLNPERPGVPFILKAWKALNSRKAEIHIQLKEVLGDIFQCQKQGRNEFIIRLQPYEAMYMKLTVKQPGLEFSTVQSELDFSYRQHYQGVTISEAYERLILDTIRGDQQHFVRRDELKIHPVMLDVGTNNLKLIDNPLYLGLRQPRLEGEKYLSIIDEFIEAVLTRCPKAIIQVSYALAFSE